MLMLTKLTDSELKAQIGYDMNVTQFVSSVSKFHFHQWALYLPHGEIT